LFWSSVGPVSRRRVQVSDKSSLLIVILSIFFNISRGPRIARISPHLYLIDYCPLGRSLTQQTAGNNRILGAAGVFWLLALSLYWIRHLDRTRRLSSNRSKRMNSTSAQKKLPKRGRTSRLLPATLVVLLFTAVPALAEPVRFNQVVQTLTSTQGVLDLRVNTLSQDPKQDGPKGETAVKTKGPTPPDVKTESVTSTVVVTGAGTTIGVEDIEDGEVEGTICDCGEIFIAGGSFPKWPFLFLAAVPIAFIDHNSDEQPTPTPPPGSSPTPTPNPTPSPRNVTETPEPASLFLFGTGLLIAGAGLRRRYAKSKALVKIGEDQ
jgi:hypothetical protein